MTQETQETPGRETGVGPEVLAWALRKFVTAFPRSFPDERAIEDKVTLWRELLDQHPWVTKPIFVAATYDICWHHKDEFLPGPAVALDFFKGAQSRIRDEAEKALPPPPPVATTPGGWSQMGGPQRRAFFERHLAIGKLQYRGVTEPTEGEIAEVVQGLRWSGFLRKTLERIEARDQAPLADIGEAMTGGRRVREPGVATRAKQRLDVELGK